MPESLKMTHTQDLENTGSKGKDMLQGDSHNTPGKTAAALRGKGPSQDQDRGSRVLMPLGSKALMPSPPPSPRRHYGTTGDGRTFKKWGLYLWL